MAMGILAVVIILMVDIAYAHPITQEEYWRDAPGEEAWVVRRCEAKRDVYRDWMITWKNDWSTAGYSMAVDSLINYIAADGAPEFAQDQWKKDMWWIWLNDDLTIDERTETIYNECFARGY